jgi:CRP-like cAMP-binding protein
MTNVGAQCNILKASAELRNSLETLGEIKRYVLDSVLFAEDGANAGVFLVLKGKVGMRVNSLPNLDRLFSTGSLLGLPSTFTGHPYSLTALTLTDAEVLHVLPEPFLQLMRERQDLCREATEILGREVSFIQAALTERRKQGAVKKTGGTMVVA